MLTEDIEWDKETELYVLVVNQYVKFGISSNWESREKAYVNELGDIRFNIIKKIVYPNRWQAELIEQVIKWRLRKWVVPGRHEWVESSIQIVMDCLHHTHHDLGAEFDKHEYIHLQGKNRWDYYKQIAEYYYK